VIREMNSEEWEGGDDCLALICVFVTLFYIINVMPVSKFPSMPVVAPRAPES
jgi:hypothetical protein